jgi:hypothetical protein
MTKYLIAMMLVGIALVITCTSKSDPGSASQNAQMSDPGQPNDLDSGQSSQDAQDPATEEAGAVPEDAVGDVCASYTEKFSDCAREFLTDQVRSAMGTLDDAQAQEMNRFMEEQLNQMQDQVRDEALRQCETMRVAGVDVLAAAIQACADSPCGVNGATWDGCIAAKIAEHDTTRKSASDPETLAGILREACIAEDYATMRSYMPSPQEVAQAFSGGHESALSSAYSDFRALDPAHKPVACPCFASLGDATPEPEMRRQHQFAQGDEVEDGVRASRDVCFAGAHINAGPGTYVGPSGTGSCHLTFKMINFGDGWKLLILDT